MNLMSLIKTLLQKILPITSLIIGLTYIIRKNIVEGVEFVNGANVSISGIKVFDENFEDFLKKAADNGLVIERDDLGAVLPDIDVSLFSPEGDFIKSVYFEM